MWCRLPRTMGWSSVSSAGAISLQFIIHFVWILSFPLARLLTQIRRTKMMRTRRQAPTMPRMRTRVSENTRTKLETYNLFLVCLKIKSRVWLPYHRNGDACGSDELLLSSFGYIYCAYAWPIASLLLFPFEQRLRLRDSGIKYVFLKSSKSHNGTLDSSY